MGTRSAAVAKCIRERSNWGKLSDVHKMDSPKFSPVAVQEDIQVASPKLYALIQNLLALDRRDIETHGHTFKHFIYSDIKSVYGAKLIASALVAFGFHHAYGLGAGARGKTFVLDKSRANAFATLTTAAFFQRPLGINFRKEILKRFNTRPDNIYGENLRIVILDSGLREGVDLFDVKYVHLFEPILTTGDQKQAVGRATRFCGQKGLAFDQGWPLHVYRYDTENLFQLFLEHSQIDLKKLTLAQTLEDVVIDAAVDRTLTVAFRLPKMTAAATVPMSEGGGPFHAPSTREIQAKRMADVRRMEAARARDVFIQKRAKEEARIQRENEAQRRVMMERRQASEERRRLIREAEERRIASQERRMASEQRKIREAEERRIASEERRIASEERRARIASEERKIREAEERRIKEEAERQARLASEERRQVSQERRARLASAERKEREAEERNRKEDAERQARLASEERRIASEERRIASEERRARLASEERRKRVAEEEASRVPPRPATVEKMDAFVQRHFADCVWPEIELKNGCDSGQAVASLDFSPTQNFIRNYLTPASPYHGLLAFHSVGTGKTCLAIATATTHFEPEGWTILYVTKTTLKGDVWKNMFDQVCSLVLQEKLRSGVVIPADKAARMRMLSKSWSRIQPLSYRQFSNMLRGKSALSSKLRDINGTKDPLNKTFVVIDEAHKLFVSDMPPSEKCDIGAVQKAFDHSYQTSGENAVKLLLMTGTPYTDDPMDMVKLLNLLLEPSAKLPETFADFAKAYLNTEGAFTADGRTAFSNHIAGQVSYLNREKDRRTFSYPIVYDITVPMASMDGADIQNAFDAQQKELEHLEQTLKALESGETVAQMEAELKRCIETAAEVNKCKAKVTKAFEGRLYEAAKNCQTKDYNAILLEKDIQVNRCLQQGPADCTPLKEQLKSTKANQKSMIQAAKQHIKDAEKTQRELKNRLQGQKDVDRSQTSAIQECLSKKNKSSE